MSFFDYYKDGHDSYNDICNITYIFMRILLRWVIYVICQFWIIFFLSSHNPTKSLVNDLSIYVGTECDTYLDITFDWWKQ